MALPPVKILDISLPISPGLPVWPGDAPVILEQVSSMDRGAHDNVSRLAMSVHAGTHVDAPHHFLNDGRTVETLSLEILTGPACVVLIPDEVKVISAVALGSAGIPEGTLRVLFKTGNSTLWKKVPRKFETTFVAIDAEGADWLVRHGIRLVGVDYLSVAPYKNSQPTHLSLLRAGIVILEGLDLSEVPPGQYNLYCLPLKLVGSEGAPARAILTR
jgi:arylformamidase